jgi:hypothetical protein
MHGQAKNFDDRNQTEKLHLAVETTVLLREGYEDMVPDAAMKK